MPPASCPAGLRIATAVAEARSTGETVAPAAGTASEPAPAASTADAPSAAFHDPMTSPLLAAKPTSDQHGSAVPARLHRYPPTSAPMRGHATARAGYRFTPSRGSADRPLYARRDAWPGLQGRLDRLRVARLGAVSR